MAALLVAALGVLGLWIATWIERDNKLDHCAIRAAMAGNTDLSRDKIAELINEATEKGLSWDDAYTMLCGR